MKTLIVDDGFFTRRVMRELLQDHSDIVDFAINGREALESFIYAHDRKHPYDLITLDIMMPEMNGHETRRRMRKFEHEYCVGPQGLAKIIMVTALEDPKNIMHSFFDEPCEGYLIKPIDSVKMEEMLQQLHFVQ